MAKTLLNAYAEYLRGQAYGLTQLAEQIERGEKPDCLWMIDEHLVPFEFFAGHIYRDGQEQLNHELVKAVEQDAA